MRANFSTQTQNIVSAIECFDHEYFTVHQENTYVYKVQSNYHQDRYILFEPQEIYTNISSFIEYAMLVHELPEGSETFRIPFFSGVGPRDIGKFLLEADADIPNVNKEIEFNTLPADFNINGLKYFSEYLDGVYEMPPVFNGHNNFNNYSEYFCNKFDEQQGRVNLILPVDIMPMTESKAIEQIFKDAANT